MSFSLLPAEKGDLRELVEIFHEAFATDPEFSIIYQKCDMEEAIKLDVVGYEEEFDTPGRRFFKVVDSENGYVVAHFLVIVLQGHSSQMALHINEHTPMDLSQHGELGKEL
jgi:hypothetical protein